MHILRNLFIVLIFCAFNTEMEGQFSYFEAGLGLGVSNYSGDMSSDNVGKVLSTSLPSATAYIRYNLTPYLNFKSGLSYARLAADDSKAESIGIVNRNLSFFTNLYEASLTAEINIFKYEPLEGTSLFTIYAMGGIAGFYYNPLAKLNGQTYELQPLGTEGQGLESFPERDFYSLYQLALPFGGGIKFKINEQLNFNAEVNWRVTFTDYLDDVSTTYSDYDELVAARGEVAGLLSVRAMNGENPADFNGRVRGNPTIRDYYFTFHAGVSYNLVDFGSYAGYGKKRSRINTSKCPKF